MTRSERDKRNSRREVVYSALRFSLAYFVLSLFFAKLVGQFILKENSIYLNYYWLFFTDASKIWILIVALLSQLLALLLLLVYFLGYRDSEHLSALPIQLRWNRGFTLSSLLLGGMIPTAFFLVLFETNQIANLEAQSLPLMPLLQFVLTFLLIALIEETAFRGYILRKLLYRFSPWAAIATSATIFAMYHLLNPGISYPMIASIWLGGIVLGQLYVSTRNLTAPIAFHFAYNFFLATVLGIPILNTKPLAFITWQFHANNHGVWVQWAPSMLLVLAVLYLAGRAPRIGIAALDTTRPTKKADPI